MYIYIACVPAWVNFAATRGLADPFDERTMSFEVFLQRVRKCSVVK